MSTPERIVVVDDNAGLRAATAELLAELGYEVEALATAGEAVALLAAEPARAALLITDVAMPGMSGIELVDRLRAGGSELAMVLMSSRHEDPALERRLAQGDVAFLAKPFRLAELEEALTAARRLPRRPLPPPMALPPRQRPAAAREERPRAAFPPAPWRWAVAAALVLAAGAGFELWRAAPPALPAAGTAAVLRGAEVEELAPVGEVPAAPALLSWRPVAGAASYRLRLAAVDERVLWEASVAAPPAALPAAVAAELQPAVAYLWRVEARDDEGRLLARSAEARFRLRPAPETGPGPRR